MTQHHEIVGMVRRSDHRTSVLAAASVKRVTLRELVLRHAAAAEARGITDDDLKAAWPEKPESSVRKRRTELAQENRLIETAYVRTNRQGQEERVWVHRDFHHNPPPIREREKVVSKSDQIVRLEAEVRRLQRILDSNGIAS